MNSFPINTKISCWPWEEVSPCDRSNHNVLKCMLMWCIWEETSWWTWVGPSWWSTSLRYMLHQRSHVAFLPQSVTITTDSILHNIVNIIHLIFRSQIDHCSMWIECHFFLAVTLTRQMAFLYVLVFIGCPFWPNFVRQLWMFTHEHRYDLGWSGRRGHKIITCSWPVAEVFRSQLCCNWILTGSVRFLWKVSWLEVRPPSTLSRSQLLSSVSNRSLGVETKLSLEKRRWTF